MKKFILLLGVSILFFVPISFAQTKTALVKPEQTNLIGRYQMLGMGHGAFVVLDTVTGNAWYSNNCPMAQEEMVHLLQGLRDADQKEFYGQKLNHCLDPITPLSAPMWQLKAKEAGK